jgi:hypothetical protein
MPSSQKLVANRANAKRGTGPRSVEGKARSSSNAFKHGLAVPASLVPDLAPDVTRLAREIAGENETDPVVLEAAVRLAEAAIDVLRARRARTELLGRLAQSPYFLPMSAMEPMPTQFMSYKPSSLAARIRAIHDGTFEELQRIERVQFRQVLKNHEDVQRIKQHNANVRQSLAQWDQFEKLDRYERRALSRRNTAIRVFDEARAAAAGRSGS